MIVLKSGKQIFGAQLTAAEKKALDIEIVKALIEADKKYETDIDIVTLYVLHTHLGFGPKRLRDFYDAFSRENQKLRDRYEIHDDSVWLCDMKLKEIGVDVAAWNSEREESG